MKKYLILLLAILLSTSSFAQRRVVDINDNWKFYFSSENSADYARTISLPHTWSYDQSMLLMTRQPTTANYIRDIYIPAQWSQKRIFVKFYGVHSFADIMVNGSYVGEHRGGSTAFTLELTNKLTYGAANSIHVIVNDAPQSDILPTSHEEDLYGGIYRDVELIVTDKTAISPLYFGSDGLFVESTKVSESSVEGEVRVLLSSTASSKSAQVELSILDEQQRVVFTKRVTQSKISDAPVTIPFTLQGAKLWSPESPNLYSFAVSVEGQETKDKVVVTSGFRTIEVGSRGLISINGVPTQFRGVKLYHDYPHVGGAASRRDMEEDIALVNEVGANAIRSASHPHHPYMYELCDREGKLVWIDFPLTKAPFLSDVAYYPTDNFHMQGIETYCEIVAQNYNHPSVAMWGIFTLLSTRGDNPIPYIKELNTLVKEMDTTRPTVAVSDQDGAINTITDLIAWNQRVGWDKGMFSDIEVWSSMLHQNWGNIRSAVTYGQDGRVDQQSEPEEYKSDNQHSAATWKPEGRQRQFHEEYAQRLLTDSLFWGVCIDNMFDFKSTRNSLGENNMGLVTFDRRDRKDIFYLYKSHWNRSEPTLHITDKRNKVSSEELYTLNVYVSEDQEPTLTTRDGESLPMRRVAPWHYVADSLVLKSGGNTFTVRQGDLVDSLNVIYETSSSRSNYRGSLIR